MVVDLAVDNILQPDLIAYIAKRCAEIQEADEVEIDELGVLRRQLSETKKAIANMAMAIEQGIITKTTKSRLAELEAHHSSL